MEIWNDIKGYEGFYEISSYGRVKSLVRMRKCKNQYGPYTVEDPEKILRPGKNNHGYMSVVLYKDHKRKTKSVHRLVAKAFIDNPNNKIQVNHKNGLKHDNRIENLEWCTNSENQIHSYRTGLTKSVYGNAKLNERQVIKIRELYNSGEYTQTELGRKFGVYKTTIHKIVRKLIWTQV